MKLTKIEIKNFKSIENLELIFDKNKKSNSGLLGFLGINEAGKSNLLKAISMKDNINSFNYEDFKRKETDLPIKVTYEFHLKIESIIELFTENNIIDIPKEFISSIKFKDKVLINSIIEKGKQLANFVTFDFEDENIKGWEKDPSNLVKKFEKTTSDGINRIDFSLNLNDLFNEKLGGKIIEISPKIIFWKSEDKYLMNSTINLNQFKENPENISIPLKNCFKITGYDKINEIIVRSNSDPAFKGDLYEEISNKVTNFINEKWPEHKVELKFEESGGLLNFFVKNIDGRRQTVNSRSDGFRQFISFLLTSSAEVNNGELKNSLILIDEPEVHLHPTSQENLLKELIKISKNNLLLFATHSSYLIDKENFSNYYRVSKKKEKTQIEQFEENLITFAEINYLVFDILTTDYHNELYGWCEIEKKLNNLNLEKDYIQIDKKTEDDLPSKKISLSGYIRHQIHHPENKKNKKFTKEELKKSIEILRGIKYGA